MSLGTISSVVTDSVSDDEEEEGLVIMEEDDSLGSVQDLVTHTVKVGASMPGRSTRSMSSTGEGSSTSGNRHIVSAPLSANTKRNMEWAVRVWEKWAKEQNKGRKASHTQLPMGNALRTTTAAELAKACSLFVSTVKKVDGSVYPPHSVYNLLFAMSRYIKFELNRPEIDILDFRSTVNEPIQEAMDDVTRKYSESEILSENKADVITWEHVKILWDKGVLNYHTAKGLSRAAFIYNSKVFGIRSGRDHRLLLLEYFDIGEDSGGQYVEFHKGKFYKSKKEANGAYGSKFGTRPKVTNTHSMAALMQNSDDMRQREYEVAGNQRSAFSVHKTYLEAVRQYVGYGPFYIKPLPTDMGTRIRFTSAAVGHNSLGTYVKDMMNDAGIQGYFTNLSAGKQEQSRMPAWVNAPHNDEQGVSQIQIVSTASVGTVGAPTYIQCLNKNIPIAPRPSCPGIETRAPVAAVTRAAATATRTLTIAPQGGAGQRQTLLLVPVSEGTTAQMARNLLPQAVGTLAAVPAALEHVDGCATDDFSNSVTVKQEVVSDDEAVQIKQESEETVYSDMVTTSDGPESMVHSGSKEQESRAGSDYNSRLYADRSRKRPLEIEPIDDDCDGGDSGSMTTLLVKKLKALEDRLQRIEQDDKLTPPPTAPDSSHDSERRESGRPGQGDPALARMQDSVRLLESRVMRLERSGGPTTRSSAGVDARLRTLEARVGEIKDTVESTNSKLRQTHNKLDKILELIQSGAHSK